MLSWRDIVGRQAQGLAAHACVGRARILEAQLPTWISDAPTAACHHRPCPGFRFRGAGAGRRCAARYDRGQDKALFDAYNACDLDTFRNYLDEGIEFYQDNDDVTTSRDALEVSFKQHCGPGHVAKQRRELVPGTLEVHPIQGYGAVEMGAHRFCEVGPDGQARKCAMLRFVHLWHDDNGHWRITRVISYGH